MYGVCGILYRIPHTCPPRDDRRSRLEFGWCPTDDDGEADDDKRGWKEVAEFSGVLQFLRKTNDGGSNDDASARLQLPLALRKYLGIHKQSQ